MTEKYDSTEDTKAHIRQVMHYLADISGHLLDRADVHDSSKLESPEKEIFDEFTPKLRTLTYGSQEYHACTKAMGPALEHHYAANSHHPEHYPNGVRGMDLIDLVEMFCDWKAATMRHADGDLKKSIEHNRKRFKIGDELAEIFENTRRRLGW